nr:hypothetical protein [Lysinibacillus sphaericus]
MKKCKCKGYKCMCHYREKRYEEYEGYDYNAENTLVDILAKLQNLHQQQEQFQAHIQA